MAIPLIALAALSAASSLSSAQMSASAQKAQARFDATQYEGNARLADFKAREATRIGEKEVQRASLQNKRLVGRQRAVAAAQGIDPDSGSALDISEETAGLSALDQVTIRNNAWKQAWGYQSEASQLRSQAAFTRIQGKSNVQKTLSTGGMQAATSIMGGFAKS